MEWHQKRVCEWKSHWFSAVEASCCRTSTFFSYQHFTLPHPHIPVFASTSAGLDSSPLFCKIQCCQVVGDALSLQTIKCCSDHLSLRRSKYLSWALLLGTQKQQPTCVQGHRSHVCLWIWCEELKGGVKADMEKYIRELAQNSALALDLHFSGWTQPSTSPAELCLS